MQTFLSQLLGKSKTTYLASCIVGILLTITAFGGIFLTPSLINSVAIFLAVFGVVIFGMLSWWSHIMFVRRKLQLMDFSLKQHVARISSDFSRDTIKQFEEIIRAQLREQSEVQAEHMSEGQAKQLEEYEKQSYNQLLALQKLRVSILGYAEGDNEQK